MRDSDEFRTRISERLAKLGQDAAWLSRSLGKNRGYIHDYLQKGSPARLDYEVKIAVSKLLEMNPRELGIEPFTPTAVKARSGMSEDAEPFVPPPSSPYTTAPHVAWFAMRSYALDQHPLRIEPGDLLAFDLNRVDNIEIGRVVVAQQYDKRDLTKCHGTIIRQFLPPNKLVTNSSDGNEIVSLDDPSLPYEIVIKGALVSITHPVGDWPA